MELSRRYFVEEIRFAVDTGGRLSELLEPDWGRVDLVNKLVRFN